MVLPLYRIDSLLNSVGGFRYLWNLGCPYIFVHVLDLPSAHLGTHTLRQRSREMGDRRTAKFDGGLLIRRRGGGEGGVWEAKRKVVRRDEEDCENNSTQIILQRVPKASLVECLSCPLCDRLCRDASTIVECLHTFCSACLRKRLKDGRTKNFCPTCSTDLGCHPFQLVRQDRLLSAIQMKLFPARTGGYT